jgi:hypothetical protein
MLRQGAASQTIVASLQHTSLLALIEQIDLYEMCVYGGGCTFFQPSRLVGNTLFNTFS